MINFYRITAFFLLFIISKNEASAQDPLPRIKLVQVFDTLKSPVCLANCNDDRIFIVEQKGIIKIGYPDGTILPVPFLNITDRVKSGGERGLLGLAFPPDFKQSGNFYVNYTGEDDSKTIISRFKISSDSNVAVKNLEEKILKINQPFSNHNGGNIAFGSDSYLYIGTGDGGSGGDPQNNSQNKQSLLGKMLRIDVSTITGYQVPPDNPFVGNTEYRSEIWAMGMRNPWRFNFDERNGNLWIADVGQGQWEEVDYEKAGQGGKNYGWRCYEGYAPYNTTGCLEESNYTFPVAAFSHSQGHCSITGGVVDIKDSTSSLYGFYFSADYCSGQFWGTRIKPDKTFETIELLKPQFSNFVAFGYDLNKNIYVSRDNGSIYRIDTFPLCTTDLLISGDNDHVGCGIESVELYAPTFENGTYTWYLDGEEIDESNTDTLTVNEAGEYTVVFRSDACSAISLKPFSLNKNEAIPVDLLDLPVEYCINGAPLVLNGNPSGGVFIGTGMEGNVFNPAVSNIGVFSITYFYEDAQGCSGFDVQNIKIVREAETNIISAPPHQCLQGAPLDLEAEPEEGAFSGPGISGDTFYPQVAGVGVHKIYFTYTPVPGCTAVDSIYITVDDCTSNTKDIDKSAYEVYPNPAQNDLIVKYNSNTTKPKTIKLINQLGQIVFFNELSEKDRNKDLYKINLASLPSGSYIIVINDAQDQFVKKIIKN